MRVLLLLFFLASNSGYAQLSNSDKNFLTSELLNKINTYRTENGLVKLEPDPILEKAALSQCEYMIKYDTLTHAQKRGTLKTPAKRVKYFKGKKFISIGENVLYQPVESFRLNKKEITSLASSLFEQWRNSPPHNANMLDTEYTFSGICILEDLKRNRVFATQVFAEKGIQVDGQLSSNGFGLRAASENCKDKYGVLSNMILNIGSGIRIEGDEIVLYHHNVSLFKKIFNSNNDGLAIDLVLRKQFPCTGPNQLDLSKVYDGVLLKPIYRNEILANNRAENPRHIISTIAKLPREFIELNEESIQLSTILINNGQACMYLVNCLVPRDDYQLLPVEPKLIDAKNVLLTGNGVGSMEQLTFEFNSSETTPNNSPKIRQKSRKILGATIQSYSSVEGDSSKNEVLHEKRAQAIRSHLISRLNIRPDQIQIDSKVNWEKMRFQLFYIGADSIANLSNDSIQRIIASGDSTVNWDSLLYVQRTSIATIYFQDSKTENLSNSEKTHRQLAQAIAQQNYSSANKCLKLLFDEKDEIDCGYIFSEGIFDALKNRPELVQNSAALLSKLYAFDVYKSTEFVFAWINRKNELTNEAKHNLLILYTKLGLEFLDKWDVSNQKLSNVVHPLRMDTIVSDLTLKELLLNTQLVFINYFGQINDSDGIIKSFDFISDYFKSKAISQEEDVKLALFFNNWSAYDRSVNFLMSRFISGDLNENGLFLLGQTLNLLDSDHPMFVEINASMAENHNIRWCEWINMDYKTMRNPKIKAIYCKKCSN